MDFRNQAIADIVMVLADLGQESVIIDESVTGTATFFFSDCSFEEALFRFTEACNLFCEKRNGAYYVSRIRIRTGTFAGEELISLDAEDAGLEALIKNLSRSLGRTILYDTLPGTSITIHTRSSLKDILEIIIKKYPDYSLAEENNAFYIKKTAENIPAGSRLSSSSIRRDGGRFSMALQRGSLSSIIGLLFKTAEREYSLLQKIDAVLEHLYFEDKSFEELLRLILEQGNCGYAVSGGVYYIFEVQRKDILKGLKETTVLQLQHIPAEEALALLPADFSGSFIKANKNANSLYLTGSTGEIEPILRFLALLDVPAGSRPPPRRFELHSLKAADFIALLPKELAAAGPLIIPGSNAFVLRSSDEICRQFENYMALLDTGGAIPVYLKYIRNDELFQYLPPSAAKEDLIPSPDPSLIFYRGTGEQRRQFLDQLKLIDRPKPQIRYQLLVIQYQRSENLTWNKSLSFNAPSGETASGLISGTFSNLLNINFDIISGFGYHLAMQLNLQLGEDKARVLADTTLNGISGQEIKFENTNTFRYRDTTIDPETGKPFYTGTTREITSGLVLNINGWVSGDGMITMKVNAAVSKQDESGANTSATTNPPPTSERAVNTQVRTRSGTPIVIGGLLQSEKNESVKKLPLLGSIPLIGRLFQDIDKSESTTELVIYIIPYVHNGEAAAEYGNKIDEYYKRFIRTGREFPPFPQAEKIPAEE
jgi:type II secretory pathway component GspD/PulD (secretin)